LTSEKEKCKVRIAEERLKYDRELQEMQAEHVRQQAQFKADTHSLVQHLKVRLILASNDVCLPIKIVFLFLILFWGARVVVLNVGGGDGPQERYRQTPDEGTRRPAHRIHS
jgi:hypothetical protein